MVAEVSGLPKASKPSLQQRMFAAFLATAADILAEALPQLLPAAAAAAASVEAVATGRVDASKLLRQQQPDGYAMHPAVLDALTHTAAALQSSQKSEAGVTRIPVGVHALLAPAAAAVTAAAPLRAAQQWCQGTFAGMSADGAALTNFQMAAGSGSLQLCGFQAKVASTAATAAAGARHTAAAASGARTAPHPGAAAATRQPAAVPEAVDASAVQQQVQRIVNKMLGAEVAPDQPLMEAGLDSLGERADCWLQRARCAVARHAACSSDTTGGPSGQQQRLIPSPHLP